MLRGSKVKLSELNPHLICVLCGGYYIDATTIIECLHTFCKTCIVRYLQTSKYCPVCDVMVHKTKPLLHIRADQTLQALVYKMVPGLYLRETKKRKDFYASNLPPDLTTQEDGMANDGFFAEHNVDLDALAEYQLAVAEEENISVSLQFSPNGCPPDAEEYECPDEELIKTRFLMCPGGFTVGLLKKFIRMKLDLDDIYMIDVFHSQPLQDMQTLMDVAYIYCWSEEEPVLLYYSIYQTVAKRRKFSDDEISHTQPEEKKSTDNDDVINTCSDQLDTPPITVPMILIDDSPKDSHDRPHRSKDRKKKRSKSKKSKKSHKSEKRNKSSKRSRSSSKSSKHKSSRKRKDSSRSSDRPPKSAKLSKDMREIPSHKLRNAKKKTSKTKRKEANLRHLKTRFLFPSSSSESDDAVFYPKPPLVKNLPPESDYDTEPLSDIPQPGRYVAASSSLSTAAARHKTEPQSDTSQQKEREAAQELKDSETVEEIESVTGSVGEGSNESSSKNASVEDVCVKDSLSVCDVTSPSRERNSLSPMHNSPHERPRSKSPKGHGGEGRSKSPKQRSSSHSPRERSSSKSPSSRGSSGNNSPQPRAKFTYSSQASSSSCSEERQPILLKLHKEKLQLAIKQSQASQPVTSVASSVVTSLTKPTPITILSKVKPSEFQQAFMKHVDRTSSSSAENSIFTNKKDKTSSQYKDSLSSAHSSAIVNDHSTFHVVNEPSPDKSFSSSTSSSSSSLGVSHMTAKDKIETSKIAKKKALLSETASRLSKMSKMTKQSSQTDAVTRTSPDVSDPATENSPCRDKPAPLSDNSADNDLVCTPYNSSPDRRKSTSPENSSGSEINSTKKQITSQKTKSQTETSRVSQSRPDGDGDRKHHSSHSSKLSRASSPHERHPNLKLVLPKYPLLSQRQDKDSPSPSPKPHSVPISVSKHVVARPSSLSTPINKPSNCRSPVELPKDLIKSLPSSPANPMKKTNSVLSTSKSTSVGSTQTMRISRPIKRVDDILKVRQASAVPTNTTSNLLCTASNGDSKPDMSVLGRSLSQESDGQQSEMPAGIKRQNSVPEARHSMPPLLPTRSSDQSLVSPKKADRPLSPLKIPSAMKAASVLPSPVNSKLPNGDANAVPPQIDVSSAHAQTPCAEDLRISEVKVGEASSPRSVKMPCLNAPQIQAVIDKTVFEKKGHIDIECTEVNHNSILTSSAKPQTTNSPLTPNSSAPPGCHEPMSHANNLPAQASKLKSSASSTQTAQTQTEKRDVDKNPLTLQTGKVVEAK